MDPVLLVTAAVMTATYLVGIFSDNSRIQIVVLLLIAGIHIAQEANQPGVMMAVCG